MQKRHFWIIGSFAVVLAVITVFIYQNTKKESLASSRNITDFETDSLHFVYLLNKGNRIYALRDKMGSISESLVYFDSALVVAERINSPRMKAFSHFYIGNVYSAWNKQPEETIKHYKKASDIYKLMPEYIGHQYYLNYMLAHAYDKAGDSLKCTAILEDVYESLVLLPDSIKTELSFLSDYAWVSTNIGNYLLAEKFLDTYVKREYIQNNPESSNYLDHYYITRARIDILGKKNRNSSYTDSIKLALSQCSNNFDRQYYLNCLTVLYLASKEYKRAFETLEKEIELNVIINTGEITDILQKNKLLKQLNDTIKEKQIVDQKLNSRNLWLVICSSGIILLVVLFRLFQIKKNRTQIKKEARAKALFTKQLFQVIEDERKRIATDLHDGIGNELTTIKHSLSGNPESWKEKIDELIDEIRTISRNLHPAMFERVGLKITLEQLVERIQYRQNFMLTTEIDYHKGLNSAVELQVYRIIQEGITNMVRHGQAIAGKITVKETEQIVQIEIKDNGIGFDVQQTFEKGKAFGLHSILERSHAIGGVASIRSGKTGTVIDINIQK